LSEKFSACGWW